jgi:hypothetical protein
MTLMDYVQMTVADMNAIDRSYGLGKVMNRHQFITWTS